MPRGAPIRKGFMIDILEKMRAENALCEIYANSEDAASYELGYVVGLTDTHYLLECVTPSGEHGGFMFGYVEDVFKVCRNTQIIRRTESLMAKARFAPKSSPVEGGGNILEELLFYVQDASRLCRFSLVTKENADYGFVKEIKGRTVTFSLVDGYGAPDGECAVLSDDICSLSFGSPYERRLELLCVGKG